MFEVKSLPAGRVRPHGETSFIASPLLNLAPTRPTGPTLQHSRRLVPLRESTITGEAILSLSPDRRMIDISVTLEGSRTPTIQLRRLKLAQFGSVEEDGEELLLIRVRGRAIPDGVNTAKNRFPLDYRRIYPVWLDAQELLKAGICFSELRAQSIEGFHVEPARKRRPGSQSEPEYLSERMFTQIRAAEASVTAVAACRHVELATLFAREMRHISLSLRRHSDLPERRRTANSSQAQGGD